MEINLHLNLGAVGRTLPTAKPDARQEQPAAGAAEISAAETAIAFENLQALDGALRDAPLSRADVVKRASELIGDVNYPPRETIQQISHLLAMRLYSDDSESVPAE